MARKNILDAKKISKIRTSAQKRRSIFSDMRYLDSLYLPTDIIGREKEAEQLVNYFLDMSKGMQIPFISVYGRSGSGKSTVVRFVCNQMSDVFATRFVNLRKSRSVFGCANTILSELGGDNVSKAFGLERIIDSIQTQIRNMLQESKKQLMVLVLDEYDVMFSDKRGNPSDFVYKLLRITEMLREHSLFFSVVAISNSTVNDYDIDDRVKSRMGNEAVFFAPYSKEDITEILHDRIRRAFSIKIPDNIVDYGAALCSADHGDARRALDLFRVAGQLCDGKKITRQDVDDAFDSVQGRRISEILSDLPSSSRRVFYAIARISYITEKKWHSTSEVYDQYVRFSADKSNILRYRRVFDILSELEQQRILTSKSESRGRQGYSNYYCLTVPMSVIGEIMPDELERWDTIRSQRFDFLHKPMGSRNDIKHARYEDKKIWRKIIGKD